MVTIISVVIMTMEYFNNHLLDVMAMIKQALVGDSPIEWESHGLVVGVFRPMDSALGVRHVILKFLDIVSGGVGDGDPKDEVHALRSALGDEHPVGDATLLSEGLEMDLSAGGHGSVCVVDQPGEAGDVGDGDGRLGRLALEHVHSVVEMVPEFIHFDAVPSAFIHGKLDTLVVGLGAEINPDDGMGISGIIVLDAKFVCEIPMIEAGHVGFHIDWCNILA